jgi:hypothetical protein
MSKPKVSSEISAYVDTDPDLSLESNSILRKFIDLFFLPVLNNLPKDFKHLIKKTNNAAKVVIDNATSHKALEVLYSKGELFSIKKLGNHFFKYIWFNVHNSKAVRNRLKFVKRELKNHLENIADTDRDVEIISIASGSSRAIIETVKHGHYRQDAKLAITFLDKNEHAISYSKQLSTDIEHLPIKLEWIQDTVGNFFRSLPEKKYDVVEIVGLLDYFSDEKVEETFAGIFQILQAGGILITSNVNHNKEEKFITKVIDWPMVYRTAEDLAKLANRVGFDFQKMKVFYEPLKIHGMVVAKK